MKKIQITVTRIYPKGKKGNSKSMTVTGVNVTPAFEMIKELFEEKEKPYLGLPITQIQGELGMLDKDREIE